MRTEFVNRLLLILYRVVSGAFLLVTLLFVWLGEGLLVLPALLIFSASMVFVRTMLREKRWRMHSPPSVLKRDVIVLRRDKGTLRLHAVLWFLIGTGFLAILVGDVTAGMTPDGDAPFPILFERVGLGLSGLFFLGACGRCFRKSVSDTVALRVDRAGIGFRAEPHPLIRWDQLGDVFCDRRIGGPVLYFRLREGAGVLQDAHPVSRAARRIGEAFGGRAFRVPPFGLNVPMETVVQSVDRLRKLYA